MAESSLCLVSLVLYFELAQWHDGGDEIGSNSFLVKDISKMNGRGLVIHLQTFLEILDNQADLRGFRQYSVRQFSENMKYSMLFTIISNDKNYAVRKDLLRENCNDIQ